MSLLFPDVTLIRAIQEHLIDQYGGSHGLRDENLLQSALDRAENRHSYNPETSIAELAAAIG